MTEDPNGTHAIVDLLLMAGEDRMARLAAIHASHDDVPEHSEMHRIVWGDELQVTGAVASLHGHAVRTWRSFGPSKDGLLTQRRASASGWIALTQTEGETLRVRIFDQEDALRSVVRIVPEYHVTHSVRSLVAVEDLKRQWNRDPEWELSATEGFEAHERELGLHSVEEMQRREAAFQNKREGRLATIAAEIEEQGPRAVAERLLTLEERIDILSKRMTEMEDR